MSVDMMSVLPRYFREILEFQELMKLEGGALEKLEALIGRVRSNNYILTCDERTLSLYEALLGITGTEGESLEERRKVVLLQMNTQLPYTMTRLIESLTGLLGKDGFRIDTTGFRQYRLGVTLINKSDAIYWVVHDLLCRWIPAHLVLEMESRSAVRREARLYAGASQWDYIRIQAGPEAAGGSYEARVELRTGSGAYAYYRAGYEPERR